MGKQRQDRGRGKRGTPSNAAPTRGRENHTPDANYARDQGTPGSKPPPGSSFTQEEIDFIAQTYTGVPSPSPAKTNGSTTPGRGKADRKRGRGRGQPWTPSQMQDMAAPGRSTLGGTPNYNHNIESSRGRGRGVGFPFGRGRSSARRYNPSKLRPDAPLSELLFQSRPLLRPVVFVRSTYTPYLFQREEEILNPVAEDVGDDESAHVPTANQVTRIFSGAINPFGHRNSSSEGESEKGEEIEEVDFHDMEKLLHSPKEDVTTTKRKANVQPVLQMVENNLPSLCRSDDSSDSHTKQSAEIGVTFAASGTMPKDVSITQRSDDEASAICEHSSNVAAPIFTIDTRPDCVSPPPEPTSTSPDDDEVIVYVAPHPRIKSSFPEISTDQDKTPDDTFKYEPYVRPTTISLASMSLEEAAPRVEPKGEASPVAGVVSDTSPPTIATRNFDFSGLSKGRNTVPRRYPSFMPPRMAKKRKALQRKKAKRDRKNRRINGRGHFAAFGALLNEAKLHDDEFTNTQDGKELRWRQWRTEDSDLDWGTEIEDVDDGLLSDGHPAEKAKGKERERVEEEEDRGMDVDPELDLDISAMKRFVGGLVGKDAETFTSMDDLKVAKQIRVEDDENTGGAQGSSDGAESTDDGEDEEAEASNEENIFTGEKDEESEEEDDDDDDDDDSDEGEGEGSPKTTFHIRLERLRAKARRRKHGRFSIDEEREEDIFERNMAWGEDGDLTQLEEILDENADILGAHNGRERNRLFRSIQNGAFSDMRPASKEGYGDIPAELQEQWEKDRQKKAERKRARELENLIQAADPFSKKKGGKKGRKAMVAAARLDPTINVIPNRIIDITTLLQMMRRFVDDIAGPFSMSLPPADKATRKNIHDLALAFNLKSQSKGKGDARYTTLSKTSKTTGVVNENKVTQVLRRAGIPGGQGNSFGDVCNRGKKTPTVPKHREGEEVGGSAPKIGTNNIGFKMLAAMGWSEGAKIGLSGGLDAPLVAIIKHSKLGLGATR